MATRKRKETKLAAIKVDKPQNSEALTLIESTHNTAKVPEFSEEIFEFNLAEVNLR